MASPPGKNFEYAAFIWLIFAALVGLILFIVSKIANSKKSTKKSEKKPEPVRVGDDRGGVRRRGPRQARHRMMAGRRDQESDDEENFEEQEDDDIEPSLPWDDDMPSGKIGAKKMRKLEMKAEKKTQREAMEAEREDRKKRQEMIDAQRKKEEEKLQKEEQLKEEETKKRKEEEAKREYEEYLILKQSFVVEGDGTGEADIMVESQSLLQEFIDYIKSAKVVLLEDIAAHFGLRTQDAINRITTLQEMERLTGVIDDRGKFIYISPEELEAVAKFIKQRGRISISDLAESSNQLINLQADKPQMEPQPIEVS